MLKIGVFFAFAIHVYAQDDPQDIVDIACGSFESMYEFDTDEGYIESPNYPEEYPEDIVCQWYINPANGIPEGQHIFIEVEHFVTEFWDPVDIYEGEGISGMLKFVLQGYYYEGHYFDVGFRPVTLFFSSQDQFVSSGFRLRFYVGESSPGQTLAHIACYDETKPAIITDRNSTLIETLGYPQGHEDDTYCMWIITPEDAPEGMYLNVIFFETHNFLFIYFNDDGSGPYETYWAGEYPNGYGLYNPESAMTLAFSAQYDDIGFQLVYYPADPACTSGSGVEVMVDERGGIQSPGYPYDIPEDISCRWLLRSSDDKQILLKSIAQDLPGDGVDCTDEYVEILDGDTEDAISLGKFCGDESFGTIPSIGSSLQIHFRTREESNSGNHTGFVFNYETIA